MRSREEHGADSVQMRIAIVRELERLTKADFKSTQDFHFKIKSFLSKGRPKK